MKERGYEQQLEFNFGPRDATPEEFNELGSIAKSKGFLLVSSSPLTRSSYHADEDFAKLQQNRINNH